MLLPVLSSLVHSQFLESCEPVVTVSAGEGRQWVGGRGWRLPPPSLPALCSPCHGLPHASSCWRRWRKSFHTLNTCIGVRVGGTLVLTEHLSSLTAGTDSIVCPPVHGQLSWLCECLATLRTHQLSPSLVSRHVQHRFTFLVVCSTALGTPEPPETVSPEISSLRKLRGTEAAGVRLLSCVAECVCVQRLFL